MPDVFTKIALQHYLVVGAIMFSIGMIGFICRRNLIIMFLCSELMFQGAAIHFVAFGAYWHKLSGQAFVIFILALAAAEAALALAIIVLLFRQKSTVDSQAFRELRG
ncbi:MAG: NADH-quinone oxidoreductase subunit NuoK [Tepidisphaeraceae bacterium]